MTKETCSQQHETPKRHNNDVPAQPYPTEEQHSNSPKAVFGERRRGHVVVCLSRSAFLHPVTWPKLIVDFQIANCFRRVGGNLDHDVAQTHLFVALGRHGWAQRDGWSVGGWGRHRDDRGSGFDRARGSAR